MREGEGVPVGDEVDQMLIGSDATAAELFTKESRP
jgi:hypothetical protein